MLGFLSGKIQSIEENTIIISTSGVGYEVCVSGDLVGGLAIGQDLSIYIHTNVRENAIELFGFSSPWEKRVFLLLTSVSGIGPRTAMGILGGLDPRTVLTAIVREDRATLGTAPGIGKKTAERLIVELSDKARKLLADAPQGTSAAAVGSRVMANSGGTTREQAKMGGDVFVLWEQALVALSGLGYSESDAMTALRQVTEKLESEGREPSLDLLIKNTLQLMSRHRGLTL